MKYLIKVANTYRVPTVQDALDLRDELSNMDNGELTSFAYTTKFIKEKGQIVEEYQLVKAIIEFNNEKEPESLVDASYGTNF
jgi:hypothetical protein